MVTDMMQIATTLRSALVVLMVPLFSSAHADQTKQVQLKPYSPRLEMVSDGLFSFTPTKASAAIAGEFKAVECPNPNLGHARSAPHTVVVDEVVQRGSVFELVVKTRSSPRVKRPIRTYREIKTTKGFTVYREDALDTVRPNVQWVKLPDEVQYRDGGRDKVTVKRNIYWVSGNFAEHTGPGVDLFYVFDVVRKEDKPDKQKSSVCYKRTKSPLVVE